MIGLAGVADEPRCWQLNLSNGALVDLLGGSPDEVPTRYAAAPAALLSLGAPRMQLHGTADESVPPDIGRDNVAAAVAAGDDARLREMSGGERMALIDPRSPAWSAAVEEVLALLARPALPRPRSRCPHRAG